MAAVRNVFILASVLVGLNGVFAERDDRNARQGVNKRSKMGLDQMVILPDGETKKEGSPKAQREGKKKPADSKNQERGVKPAASTNQDVEEDPVHGRPTLDLARENQVTLVKRSVNEAIEKHFGSKGGEQSFAELEPLLKKIGFPEVTSEEFMGKATKLSQKMVETKMTRFIDGLHDYPMTHLSLPEAFLQFKTGSSPDLVSVSALQTALEDLKVDPDEIAEIIEAAKSSGDGAKGDVFNYKEFVSKYDKNGLSREGDHETEAKE
mmetsp:Transcript_70963/g.148451  ORF Transcript_70963/g.148451 Transcript_70963/m.148451 type:complete len:265 (+) Transcript_70963:255-1049(+)